MNISLLSFLGIQLISILVLGANLYQFRRILNGRDHMFSQLDLHAVRKRRTPYVVASLYILSTGVLMAVCGFILFLLP